LHLSIDKLSALRCAGNFRVVVLRKGSAIVSAATLRVCGTAYAELPFVATKDGTQLLTHTMISVNLCSLPMSCNENTDMHRADVMQGPTGSWCAAINSASIAAERLPHVPLKLPATVPRHLLLMTTACVAGCRLPHGRSLQAPDRGEHSCFMGAETRLPFPSISPSDS